MNEITRSSCYAPGVHVAVAAWIGSPNAGDELVHAGLRRHLAALGATPVVPARPLLVAAVARRRVDALVVGGGGLVQDETSAANLPYHLLPALVARVPAAGVGLGAGPLTTRAGRALAHRALRRLLAVSVRDAASADLLAGLGLPRPVVAADLAFALGAPDLGATGLDDVVVVSLRPWGGRRHRLPVALRRAAEVDPAHADRAGRALDAVAAATGLGLRLVALDPPKDGPFLRAVADRVTTPVEVIVPSAAEVPAVVGRGRLVVAMRYHAAVAAALGRRPAVLLGYSPKVGGLADDLGAPVLPWDLADADGLVAAAEAALADDPARLAARVDALVAREAANRTVLEQLLSAARR